MRDAGDIAQGASDAIFFLSLLSAPEERLIDLFGAATTGETVPVERGCKVETGWIVVTLVSTPGCRYRRVDVPATFALDNLKRAGFP